MSLTFVILWLLALILSTLLTNRVRHYALAKQIVDIPNERSSHTIITPRGGGLSFVIVFVLAMLVLGFLEFVAWPTVIAFTGAGVLVAAIGYLDDRGGISPLIRLIVHVAAAAWMLFWLGGVPSLHLGSIVWQWGWLGNGLALLGIVWLINLYNFMDGIDGLAGMQADGVYFDRAILRWQRCNFATIHHISEVDVAGDLPAHRYLAISRGADARP